MVSAVLNTRCGRKKGTPKTGGRKMGTPNKATVEVRAWARGVVEDPQVHATTLDMARTGRLAPAVLIELLHYAYGKPKETTDLTVRVSRMVRIIPPHEAAS
jgi:hypothetical protein